MNKKTTLFFMLVASLSFGQQQIGNAGFETWETVASAQEPTNWNSFLSAQGSLSGFAANQVEASTDVRPGTTGTKSARIWTRSAAFGIKANGNLTLGKINMGSTSPSGADNYNFSLTTDPLFSEAITDTPDSLVFWVKYTWKNPGSGHMARVKATLHDNYNYRDPEDATSSSHVVATAVLNYTQTTGWERKSIPFTYSGPASGNTHILITFTTNQTAGGGDVDDEVIIDDVELIYNSAPLSVEESSISEISVAATSTGLVFGNLNGQNGNYRVYNLTGAMVQAGTIANQVSFNQPAGVYLVTLETAEGILTRRIYKK